MKTQHTLALRLIIFTCSSCFIAMLFIPAIPQPQDYHLFSDDRHLICMDNFLNVVSNLPFLLIGLLGLKRLHPLEANQHFKAAQRVLFSSLCLVALGSAYYHLNPNNHSLLWDRLPIAIAFMSLYSLIIYQHCSQRWGQRLLIPLIIAGSAAVLHWYVSELLGTGDLRFYLLVQIIPMLTIPIILLGLNLRGADSRAYWYLLACYLLAKLCECYDDSIFELLGEISGHSLKHLFAALGLYFLLPKHTHHPQP